MCLEACDNFEESWDDDIVYNQAYWDDHGYREVGKVFFLKLGALTIEG